MNESAIIKEKLLTICKRILNERAEHARAAMNQAQASANEEEKSTAGNKHDTARAMSQNIRDMNARQLQEALNDLTILNKINPESDHKEVRTGALIRTSAGNFFIGVSIGEIKLEKETFYVVSPMSPIGKSLLNKKKGDTLVFKGTTETIQLVS